MASPQTRVIVTGGNGFTGYHVIRELNRANCVVSSIDEADRRKDIDAFQNKLSLHDQAIKMVMDNFGPDYVIHLAATHYIPYCNAHPVETFHNNVMGTVNLLRSIPERVKGMFVASSAAVYEPSLMPHKETSPTWPTDVYGLTKVAMEHLVRKWSMDRGVPVCIGRYFNMYGWGETTPHLIPVIVSQLLDGETHLELGNIDTRRDYVYVGDNARSTVLLLLAGYNGPVNLGTGVSYSARDIIRMLAKDLDINISFTINPARVRKVDRPNLVADMTEFNIAGLPQPMGISQGLQNLLVSTVGPYMKEPE